MSLATLLHTLDRRTAPPSAPELGHLLRRVEVTLDDVAPHLVRRPETYGRSCFWSGAWAELFVLTWGPGHSSTIHDHGGSSCGILVIAGLLQERQFCLRHGQLTATATRTLERGRGSVLGSEAVHQVRNCSEELAVSLHLYLPGVTFNTYAEDG